MAVENCLVTNSLCSPSRASILTGTYSHINDVLTLSTPIDASQPTFITQLRDAGYQTAMIGKWHLGHGESHDPQGFDYWDVVIDQGEYWNPRFLSEDGVRTIQGYATHIITALAPSRDRDRPRGDGRRTQQQAIRIRILTWSATPIHTRRAGKILDTEGACGARHEG